MMLLEFGICWGSSFFGRWWCKGCYRLGMSMLKVEVAVATSIHEKQWKFFQTYKHVLRNPNYSHRFGCSYELVDLCHLVLRADIVLGNVFMFQSNVYDKI